MKSLDAHLDDYLRVRRQLGFKLSLTGSLLRSFVRFAEEQDARFITTELALCWATAPRDCQPAQWANRLSMVRRWARHLSAIDPRTEVPPRRLLPHRHQRKTPYLYRDEEVLHLVRAARELDSPQGLRGATASTCFGLLAATGMRVGEAIALNRDEVDLNRALLTIRHAKGHRSRLVPLHTSTAKALHQYERLRDQICPRPQSPRFFLSERGTPLVYGTVRAWFKGLWHRIGWRQSADQRGPRLHDLRHRFCIRTLLHWYRTDQDVEAHLPELATYVGHGEVTDTYWYLSATPELLRLATRRWERGGRQLGL